MGSIFSKKSFLILVMGVLASFSVEAAEVPDALSKSGKRMIEDSCADALASAPEKENKGKHLECHYPWRNDMTLLVIRSNQKQDGLFRFDLFFIYDETKDQKPTPLHAIPIEHAKKGETYIDSSAMNSFHATSYAVDPKKQLLFVSRRGDCAPAAIDQYRLTDKEFALVVATGDTNIKPSCAGK